MEAYYNRRAPEYDDWYLGTGLFMDQNRPGWDKELRELVLRIRGLDPAYVLDAACGTGFLTRHLKGEIVGVDQSEAMIKIARTRVPGGKFVVGDALALPFPDASFARLFTGHFYGHLRWPEREVFLAEARRVADELVVVDAALREGVRAEESQDRVLSDGSRHKVYKRYFTGEGLAEELGGGQVLYSGRWFVMVAV